MIVTEVEHVYKDRIQLWVDALRSGKYTQGRCNLRNPLNEFCCLGVACIVAQQNGAHTTLPWEATGDDYANGNWPEQWANWFGFTEWGDKPGMTRLDLGVNIELIGGVRANDELNWSFTRIANALEERYLQSTEVETVID